MLLGLLEEPNDLYVDNFGMKKQTQRQLKAALQRDIANYINELEPNAVYVEHVAWIDFQEFHVPKPIYINLVRDPVERMISWYYYARNSYKNAIEYRKFPDHPTKSPAWYKKDFNVCVRSGDPECQYVPNTVIDVAGNYKRQSLFFCGHSADCLPFDSPYAIQIAKQRVETDYAVVGTWEETNVTLEVFEKYIPRFFKGATTIYYKNIDTITNRNRNNRKPKIANDVREMIRSNFTHEYEFYYFCRQRLFKQYIALKRNDLGELD